MQGSGYKHQNEVAAFAGLVGCHEKGVGAGPGHQCDSRLELPRLLLNVTTRLPWESPGSRNTQTRDPVQALHQAAAGPWGELLEPSEPPLALLENGDHIAPHMGAGEDSVRGQVQGHLQHPVDGRAQNVLAVTTL